MDDRIRTGDRLDHNQELYQLSYVHRAAFNLACWLGRLVGGSVGREATTRLAQLGIRWGVSQNACWMTSRVGGPVLIRAG